MDIREGVKIRFTPSGWMSGANGAELDSWVKKTVDGVVDFVNREHGWFRVAYVAKGEVCHECFKMPVLEQDRIKRIERK